MVDNNTMVGNSPVADENESESESNDLSNDSVATTPHVEPARASKPLTHVERCWMKHRWERRERRKARYASPFNHSVQERRELERAVRRDRLENTGTNCRN